MFSLVATRKKGTGNQPIPFSQRSLGDRILNLNNRATPENGKGGEV
jgi:hypothetical protein